MKKNRLYKRFADCIPVKGYTRSAILDITRKEFKLIPTELYEVIRDEKSISDDIAPEYLQYLIENEYVFEVSSNEISNFPSLPTDWKEPALIANAVIEVEDTDMLNSIIGQLSPIGCEHYVLICSRRKIPLFISKLHEIFDKTSVRSIEIYAQYEENITIESLNHFLYINPRVSYILFYKSPFAKIITQNKIRGNIIFCKQEINPKVHIISPYIFTVNMPLYTESLHYNTFYNRKVCITSNGEIKNYFTSNEIFGNINKDSLQNIVTQPDFQRYWTIKKDLIAVCRDCEFRYMCVDAREPHKTDKGDYYFNKDSKCPYNPYICLWEGQDGYVPVEECGTYSRETGFVPDKEKIAKLNQQIWGEEE